MKLREVQNRHGESPFESAGGTEMGGKINSAFLLFSTFLPSFLRVLLLRMLGHKIGRNVHISILTILHAPKIEMGDDVRIGPLNIIKCGDEVKIGFSSQISFLVIIYGRGSFHLGARSYVSVKTFIDTTGGVEIGDYSGTGPGTMIFSHASLFAPDQRLPEGD